VYAPLFTGPTAWPWRAVTFPPHRFRLHKSIAEVMMRHRFGDANAAQCATFRRYTFSCDLVELTQHWQRLPHVTLAALLVYQNVGA
jgi:hypothetical protein